MKAIIAGVIMVVVLASLLMAGAIALRYILLKKKRHEMPQEVQLIAKVVIITVVMLSVCLVSQIGVVKDFLQPIVNSLNEIGK